MTNGYIKKPKKPIDYYCIDCAFRTKHKGDYSKHLLTAKHIRMSNDDNKTQKHSEKPILFDCDCGKSYTTRQGLYRHKKLCIIEEPTPIVELININIIMDIIKENQEIKNLLIDQNKQVIELHKENNILINKLVEKESSVTNITNNQSNQSFNLNLFLNETCKDAMNMKEFIENLKVTFEDLLTIGNAGFVNGVSDLLLKSLRDIEVTKRPIHCTDVKRETMYLKEDNEWNKDDKENTKFKKAIERIEYKNVVALHNWCNENLDARINNTPNNLLKDRIYFQTLLGDEKSRDKIIKNIAKDVIISRDL